MMAGPSKVGLAATALAAIVAAAVFSAVVDVRDTRRMPDIEEIHAGNAVAASALGPNGVFLHYPRWFDDARLRLDRRPFLMGDPVDTWELAEYDRVVQLVSRSHLADADAEATAIGLTDLEVLFESERYLVRAGALPAPTEQVLWDGFRALPDATVSQRRLDGEETSCTIWRDDAWHCGRVNEYIHVGLAFREMGDENPHRCVIANAPEGNASWVVQWHDVPAAGATLRWRAGNEFMAIRSDRGQPVVMSVFVDDRKVWERSFPIHDTSYDLVEAQMPSRDTANVRVELHAADHFDRFFCFRPQVVR